MFGWLFKKKEAPGIAARSYIYMKRLSAWTALLQKARSIPGSVIVYWFDDHGGALAAMAGTDAPDLVHYRQAVSPEYHGRTFLFAGHYPFYSREQQLYSDLDLKQPEVYASLEDAVFQLFGGQRITALMQKMGYRDDEAVTHAMIVRSLVKAQKKMEAEAGGRDGSARNESDWLRVNFPNAVN